MSTTYYFYYGSTATALLDIGLFIVEVSVSQTDHARYDSYARVISPSHRPIPDNTQHSRDSSMPPVGFETDIPASQRRHTHVLNCAAIGIGCNIHTRQKYNFHQPT